MKNTIIIALLFSTLYTHAIERPNWAGFYLSFCSPVIDTKKFPFIKGAADHPKWSDLEPQPGVYDWSKMDANIRNALNGGYYYYFVLWSGPMAPDWIYTNGVAKVVTNDARGRTFPFYLDADYIFYFHRLITKLAEHLASLTEAERNTIAFFQPTFGSTGDRQLYKGKPLDQQYDISHQQYLDFCSAGTIKFYDAFNIPELKHIKFLFNIDDETATSSGTTLDGEALYGNWIRQHYTIDLRKQQYTTAIGYQVNGEIIQDSIQRASFYGLDGKDPDLVRGEINGNTDGGMFNENMIWNLYWTAISTVDRGLDLWEVYYDFVKTGLYNEAFEFANKYSYHKRPQSSPYAFIALRDVLDASDINRFPIKDYGPNKQSDTTRLRKIEAEFSKYGAKVGDLNAATMLSGSNYVQQSLAMNDVGYQLIARNYSRFITQIEANNTSVGLWRVGPTDQPYGRYARAFEYGTNRNRMYFDLNDNFLPSSNKSIDLKIIYLDEGTGSFSLRYDASTDHDKIAKTITKTDSKKWVQVTVPISDGVFLNMGPKNSDFSLVNEDSEDDTFHMIEITKNSSNLTFLKNDKIQESIVFNQKKSEVSWNSALNFDELIICNVSGKEIAKFSKPINNTIDLSSFEDGLYICNLLKNHRLISSEKIIKSRK